MPHPLQVVTYIFRILKVQLIPCSFFQLSIINDVTKLKYIFRLFINYIKSLEGKIQVYVFARRNSITVEIYIDICKLIRQEEPLESGLA